MKHTLTVLTALLLTPLASLHAADKPTQPAQTGTVADDLVLNYHLVHPGGDSLPGDPNAAFHLDGVYHLHYILSHPWGKKKRSFSFVHVTSPDMLHWTWQTTKLQPSFTGHGMFSGTGFITREGACRNLSRPGIGQESNRHRQGPSPLGLGETVCRRSAKPRRHGGEDLELRIFIDKYLVEVFANGRQATVAMHADYLGKPDLAAFTVGAPTTIKKVEIWKLTPTNQGFLEAQKNRIWEPDAK